MDFGLKAASETSGRLFQFNETGFSKDHNDLLKNLVELILNAVKNLLP